MKELFFVFALAALVFPLDALAGTVSGTVRFAIEGRIQGAVIAMYIANKAGKLRLSCDRPKNVVSVVTFS